MCMWMSATQLAGKSHIGSREVNEIREDYATQLCRIISSIDEWHWSIWL